MDSLMSNGTSPTMATLSSEATLKPQDGFTLVLSKATKKKLKMRIRKLVQHIMDGGKDKLSALPDHLLLSILGRVDTRTVISTRILSRRWRHLPWRLTQIDIQEQGLRRALPALAKAIEGFLAVSTSERTIKSFSLRFRLPLPKEELNEKYTSCRSNVGNSLVEAIDGGKVAGSVELDIWGEATLNKEKRMRAPTYDDARRLMRFAGVSTRGVFARIHKLALCYLSFAASDNIITKLLSSCKLLESLRVIGCEWDEWDVVEIDAPGSGLKDLTMEQCILEIVMVHRLPRLASLTCSKWRSPTMPLCFVADGGIPCLEELILMSRASDPWQERFILSDLLRNTTNISSAFFSFFASKIWIHPEDPKQLAPAFSKLKTLTLTDIYHKCDLSWAILLLEAAPVLEVYNIAVYPSPDGTMVLAPVSDDFLPKSSNFKHCHLKKLNFARFMPEDNQIEFIRLVLQRAVRLRIVILAKFDKDQVNLVPTDSMLGSSFPDNEDQKNMVVKELKKGISSPAQIVVRMM